MFISTVASIALAQTQSTPTSTDDCLRAAFDIAEKAEAKRLSNDELDKIEDLLTKMEEFCDAQQFHEAMLVHKDISALIEPR